jgi:O-antigen ligase
VRENTNRAAIQMVEERPLAGVGWARYETRSPLYFEQSGDTPLEGVGEGVHNVLLSHASELGLVGAFLWASAFVWAIGGSLWRRLAPELEPWRMGLAALAVAWVVVAAVTPLPYAMPTLLLFTWAGVVRSVRTQVDGPRPLAMSP